ncbi:uncharacterized protein BJ171DRAFT_41359 [Polychytrium aggregatum]|uniref:uncharacterized protein n=1 Tax=Polychytrium aggregatum TaxID=110093 RepID=UPI0022FF30A6|nr:uncharacterized protein BJ171DRAFT_41359 [Polychytrium aggregatum]KAI9206112.1 hypothetical protein BJ171DRAFT_41359 [Polychytrium aggregatum]
MSHLRCGRSNMPAQQRNCTGIFVGCGYGCGCGCGCRRSSFRSHHSTIPKIPLVQINGRDPLRPPRRPWPYTTTIWFNMSGAVAMGAALAARRASSSRARRRSSVVSQYQSSTGDEQDEALIAQLKQLTGTINQLYANLEQSSKDLQKMFENLRILRTSCMILVEDKGDSSSESSSNSKMAEGLLSIPKLESGGGSFNSMAIVADDDSISSASVQSIDSQTRRQIVDAFERITTKPIEEFSPELGNLYPVGLMDDSIIKVLSNYSTRTQDSPKGRRPDDRPQGSDSASGSGFLSNFNVFSNRSLSIFGVPTRRESLEPRTEASYPSISRILGWSRRASIDPGTKISGDSNYSRKASIFSRATGSSYHSRIDASDHFRPDSSASGSDLGARPIRYDAFNQSHRTSIVQKASASKAPLRGMDSKPPGSVREDARAFRATISQDNMPVGFANLSADSMLRLGFQRSPDTPGRPDRAHLSTDRIMHSGSYDAVSSPSGYLQSHGMRSSSTEGPEFGRLLKAKKRR